MDRVQLARWVQWTQLVQGLPGQYALALADVFQKGSQKPQVGVKRLVLRRSLAGDFWALANLAAQATSPGWQGQQ